jgi:hypothetical protein
VIPRMDDEEVRFAIGMIVIPAAAAVLVWLLLALVRVCS